MGYVVCGVRCGNDDCIYAWLKSRLRVRHSHAEAGVCVWHARTGEGRALDGGQ